MNVGRRVARLRESHGESLRQAAARTGVSHTTIARIERGEVTGSLEPTLRKIAEGYGVRVDYLLAGRDLRQEFTFSLHRLSPQQRARLHFAPPGDRIRMVLRFLLSEYPDEFSSENLARDTASPPELLRRLLDSENAAGPGPEELRHLAQGLSRLVGIPLHWFHSGSMVPEGTDLMPPETVSAFVRLMRKAAQAGVSPDVLDVAIDLLIMKNKEMVSAGAL